MPLSITDDLFYFVLKSQHRHFIHLRTGEHDHILMHLKSMNADHLTDVAGLTICEVGYKINPKVKIWQDRLKSRRREPISFHIITLMNAFCCLA
jgi:hypothetical protein